MAEDIKSLTKKIVELEKRLKFSEAKIKVLADTMTDAKDIEKYLAVLQKKMEKDLAKGLDVSEKAIIREMEVSKRSMEANEKAVDKEYQQQRKENDKINKELQKMAKESVRQAEISTIQARLATLEAHMKAALTRK